MNIKFMRLVFYCLAAGISATGTIPYAYAFSQKLEAYNSFLAIIIGVIFAASAAFANMILGVYSLVNFSLKEEALSAHYIGLSICSAIPLGFMNFFAFHNILYAPINMIVTFMVITTNAAIAYNAILNVLLGLKRYQRPKNLSELSAKEVGFVVGVLVSLAGFVATTNGLNQIVTSYLGSERLSSLSYLSATIGFIVWMPFAALYGNSTQRCFNLLFKWLQKLSINIKKLTKFEVGIFIFALFSASSYTQIFIIFFNKEMLIPEFLKISLSQFIIYKLFLPLVIVSACSVNYLAIINLLKFYRITRNLKKI